MTANTEKGKASENQLSGGGGVVSIQQCDLTKHFLPIDFRLIMLLI